MSVAYILNQTYSYVENSKLNPALEVGTSLKAPVHYVEDLTISKTVGGNMSLGAPVVEATQIEAPIGVIDTVNVETLIPKAGATGSVVVDGGLDVGSNYDGVINVRQSGGAPVITLNGTSGNVSASNFITDGFVSASAVNLEQMKITGSTPVVGYVPKVTTVLGSGLATIEWAADAAGSTPNIAQVLAVGSDANGSNLSGVNQLDARLVELQGSNAGEWGRMFVQDGSDNNVITLSGEYGGYINVNNLSSLSAAVPLSIGSDTVVNSSKYLEISQLKVDGSLGSAGQVLGKHPTTNALVWKADADAQGLAGVLSISNSAGSSSIDMNSQDITSASNISTATMKCNTLTTADPAQTQINMDKNLNLSSNVLYAQTINAGNTITALTTRFGVEPNRWTGFDTYTLSQVDGDNRVTTESGADLIGWHDVQSKRGKFYAIDASDVEKFSATGDGAVTCVDITNSNRISTKELASDSKSGIEVYSDLDMNTKNIGGINNVDANYLHSTVIQSGTYPDWSLNTADNVVRVTKLLPVYKLQKDFYVSPNGDDTTANGSIENPYATIQACITAVEALTAVDNTYRYIHVMGGDYSSENITITKKVHLLGEGVNNDACGVGCQLGTISIAMNTNGGDMFNNQVCINGMFCFGISDTASTANYVLNIVNSYIYALDRGIYMAPASSSVTDLRLWTQNLTILSANASSTNPLVEITKGMMKASLCSFTARGFQSVIKFAGSSRVDSLALCQFNSATTSTTAPPIVEITSSTASAFTFGNCSFAYASGADKSASPSSCAIYANSSTTASTIVVVYNVFALSGTDNSSNYVINHGAIPCVTLYFSNSATLNTTHTINGTPNDTKFSLQAVA